MSPVGSTSRFAEVLHDATRARRALPAFTCYTLEALDGCLESCLGAGAPLIVLVSPSLLRSGEAGRLIRAFRGAAADAALPVLIQVDHVADQDLVLAAAELEPDAVMVDGSKLDFEANVAFTREMCERLHDRGIAVESELGRVEGGEDHAAAVRAGEMTRPDQVADFADRTGVDCLAVAIGNVHGHYATPPQLDLERLSAIRAAHDVPLALHGASGLPAEQLRGAVERGVSKINVNTELRGALLAAARDALAAEDGALDVLRLVRAQRDAVASVAAAKLRSFGWAP